MRRIISLAAGLADAFTDTMKSWFGFSWPQIGIVDVIEIFLIAVLFYKVLVWIKNTRAWNLFKGIIVILVFVLIAAIFQMSTILWLAKNTLNIALTAIIIIFQPELRTALENLGGRNFLGRFFQFSRNEIKNFSDKTVDELVRACFLMGRVKTGALIVIEDEILLDEYVRTGIDVDGIVTSQLLINIFEKNTPLHDGAVIIRGDRVASATCYLPLSDNMQLSKDLGTRHRAAVGVSEKTDSMTLVVSEETGKVSVAYEGRLTTGLTQDQLRSMLKEFQHTQLEENRWDKMLKLFTGEIKMRDMIRRDRNEKKNS